MSQSNWSIAKFWTKTFAHISYKIQKSYQLFLCYHCDSWVLASLTCFISISALTREKFNRNIVRKKQEWQSNTFSLLVSWLDILKHHHQTLFIHLECIYFNAWQKVWTNFKRWIYEVDMSDGFDGIIITHSDHILCKLSHIHAHYQNKSDVYPIQRSTTDLQVALSLASRDSRGTLKYKASHKSFVINSKIQILIHFALFLSITDFWIWIFCDKTIDRLKYGPRMSVVVQK